MPDLQTPRLSAIGAPPGTPFHASRSTAIPDRRKKIEIPQAAGFREGYKSGNFRQPGCNVGAVAVSVIKSGRSASAAGRGACSQKQLKSGFFLAKRGEVIKDRWIKAVILSAAVLAAAPTVVLAQNATTENAAEAAQQDLERQKAILTGPQATRDARDESAKRLLSRGNAAADDILESVLKDPANRDGQVAVAHAIASANNPPARFIEPLGMLLTTFPNTQEATEASAQALARYTSDDRARNILTNFVIQPNAKLPPSQRAAAVRALGRMVEKGVAQTLIDLMRTEQDDVVRNAAFDALGDMTGLSYGRDAQQWNQWWVANRNASPLDWTTSLLIKNNLQASELKTRIESAQDTLTQFITIIYGKTPEKDRAAFLTEHLKSASEDVRLAATRFIYDQARASPTSIPESLKQTLRGMIGDSSTQVRMQVARTLTAVNDPGAVQALLTQLAQEKDPDVKAVILTALGPTNDLAAVNAILASLDDASYEVSIEAARALKDMAARIRDPNTPAGTASKVAQALKDRLSQATQVGRPADSLRAAIVDSMAAVADPSFRQLFVTLTNSDSRLVRSSAYKGLGNIADPGTINQIAAGLQDIDGPVRLEAVNALRMGPFEDVLPILESELDPSREKDSSVRDKAWDVLAKLFPKASASSLNRLAEWTGRLGQFDHRAAALTAEIEKLDAANQQQAAATARENLGVTLLKKLNRPDEAALVLRKELDYWDSVVVAQATKEPVRQLYLESLLKAKKFADAIQFACGIIQENQANETAMWGKVREQLDEYQKQRDWDSALALINEALKVQCFDPTHKGILDRERGLVDAQRHTGGWYWVRSRRNALA